MIIRTCICIPTYNNPDAIAQVVTDCLSQTPYPILVVDDGSDGPVADLLVGPGTSTALSSGRLRILRFPKNQGKGAALRAAIDSCVREGFTHLFCVDGDGQHLVSEVPKLVEAAKLHPWDLIIGHRKLSSSTVTKTTKFGRRFSNFWVGFQTGASVSDSQSGFRIYPLFRVQNMRFWTRKYDFEIEVLIRLIWAGVNVREVEIDVFYPPPEERVSHFHKFWDNARLSVLNTVLVTLSLLKSKRSPVGIGIALGVGVFIGCTPFIGFHTLIGVGLALLLRLNAVLVLVGTQISFPPLIPLLAIASLRIYEALSGSAHAPMATLVDAAHQYSHWVSGSLILGAALGGAAGLTGFFAARLLQRKSTTRRNWSGKNKRGGRFGNWFLKTVAQRLGLKAAYFCLYFVIPYFYLFAPSARRAANEYWRTVSPETGFFGRQWLVCVQLFTYGCLVLDRVFQGFTAQPQFTINSQGMEIIRANARSERGLILVTAHVGGWDMASSLLKADGFSWELHVLHYEAQGLTLNKVAGHKGREHIVPLAQNQAAQPILQVRQILQEGKPIAIMGDRPLSAQYELVSFFGKLAPLDTTPFRIAAICDAVALFTFGFKGKGRVYDFYATPTQNYRYVPGENKTLRCQQWTQEFATTLEGFLKKYPEQWSNFFPFWSAVPAPPEGDAVAPARNYLIEELAGSLRQQEDA